MNLPPTDPPPAPADGPKEPPHWGEPLGAMAFGVMFLVCLYVTAEGAATLWNAYRVDHTYAPTTATVLEADLGSREDGRGRTVYRPKVWAELDWSWAYGTSRPTRTP